MNAFAELILHSWASTKTDVHKELQPYWSFRDEIAIIDRTAIKVRRILIPESLQDKAHNQLHLPYWHRKTKNASMQVYILDQHEHRYRSSSQGYPICFVHQATYPKDKVKSHDIAGGHGNVLDLTSLQSVTNIILAL